MSSNEDDLKKGKRPCYRTLKEYSSASTTHGIAYVFEDDRLIIERVLWIIVIIIAIFFAASLSISAYTNWQDDPVLTSVGTTGLPIEKVLFPSITICAQGSAREIVDSAFVKQFTEYLLEKDLIFSELTVSQRQQHGASFLADKYPGAKVPPNQLVGMMASPTADAEKTLAADAVLNPAPAGSCQSSSTTSSTITVTKTVIKKVTKRSVDDKAARVKRFNPDSSAKFCPDAIKWWYNGYGTCVHFKPDGKMSRLDAETYCTSLCQDCQIFQMEHDSFVDKPSGNNMLGYVRMWPKLAKSGNGGGFPGGPVSDDPFWIAATRDPNRASAFYYDDFGNRPVVAGSWPVAAEDDNTMARLTDDCITLTRKGSDTYKMRFIADSVPCTSNTKNYVFCMVDASTEPFTTVATTTTVETTTITTSTIPTTSTAPEPIPGQNLPKMPCITAGRRRKRASTSNTRGNKRDCKDYDLKVNNRGKPFIFMHKKWNPICGHYFWDDDISVRKFCNELGYSTGIILDKGKEKKADNDHFRIGKCAEADTWPTCTGGCNGMALGGKCRENEEKKCDEGNNIGFYVNCSGDYNEEKARERTCKDDEEDTETTTANSTTVTSTTTATTTTSAQCKDGDISESNLTVCQTQTKELSCGENKIIQILEGTNYGHLDANTCNDGDVTTTTSSSVGSNNDASSSGTNNAAGSSGTNNVVTTAGTNLAADSSRTSNAASPSGTNDEGSTSGTNNAADTTEASSTSTTQVLSNYTQCKVENATEKVEELCQNKTKCSLQASDNIFGNSCKNGSHVYLFVKYQCKASCPTTTTVAPTTTSSSNNDSNLPQNIKKLGVILDPSKSNERKQKVIDARKKYDEEFGSLDMKKAYANLFEILWYSQLPCFDVRNITSEARDEMSLIKRCYWKGRKISCSSIFLTRPTDRGMCCTFNMQKAEDIFKKSKYASALASMQQQDITNGFEDGTVPEWYQNQNEPRTQPGQNKGLRLIIDAHTDRISPSTVSDNFRGFSTVIDGGDKYPLTTKNSFLIRPGRENYVALSALSVKADPAIQNVTPKKRNCFFPKEHGLDMHNNYSRSNCILECGIKYARRMMVSSKDSNTSSPSNMTQSSNETVGCAPWFYPANDEEYTNVCDPWETKRFQKYMTNVPDNECQHCLPDCTDTVYQTRVSAAPFRTCDHTNLGSSSLCDFDNLDMNPPIWSYMVEEEFTGADLKVPEYAKPDAEKLSNIRKSIVDPSKIKDLTLLNYYENHKTYNAFEKDISIVNFYFDQSNIVQFKRSLRMTMTDYISQMGGLLGLGIGFSFVSAVEIIYWLTIRLFRNMNESNKVGNNKDRPLKEVYSSVNEKTSSASKLTPVKEASINE